MPLTPITLPLSPDDASPLTVRSTGSWAEVLQEIAERLRAIEEATIRETLRTYLRERTEPLSIAQRDQWVASRDVLADLSQWALKERLPIPARHVGLVELRRLLGVGSDDRMFPLRLRS